MARTVIYAIWILFPLFFFGIALWSGLERLGGRDKRDNIGDYFRQGLFVSGCVAAAIVIDQLFLESLVSSIFPPSIPFMLFKLLLLPFVFYLASMLIGPSKAVRSEKSSHKSDRRRR